MATNAEVDIHLALPRDCIELAELSRVAIEHGLRWRWKPARVLDLINNPECTVIQTRGADGRVTGFAAMEFLSVHGHLCLLATRSDQRQQGIGRAMLNWLEESARVAGLSYISLEVRERNARGIRFYERAGYEIQLLKHGYYEGRENAYRMSRQLIDAEQAARRP